MKNSKTHSPLLYFIVHSTFHFGSLLRNGIRYPFFFSFEIYLILTVFNIYYIRWWDSADILYSFCVHVCVCVISIHRTSRNTLFKQSDNVLWGASENCRYGVLQVGRTAP